MDSSEWDARYSSVEHPWGSAPAAALSARFAELTPGRAIDLGCGDGRHARWLADAGWTVHAVDFSSAAIEIARSGGVDRSIDYTVADARTWEPSEPSTAARGCRGRRRGLRAQNPSAPITDREHRGAHAAPLTAAQQVGPGLGGLVVAVVERDEFLGTVGAHPDHHQRAHLVLLQAHLEVDPVDPDVDVVAPGQRTLVERSRLVLPVLGEPGDRARRQPDRRAEELLPSAGAKSLEESPCR